MSKNSRVNKWGNSFAIRIPREIIEQYGLKEGAEIKWSIENGKLCISKATRLTLDQMLDRFDPQFAGEVMSCAPVGLEIIK